MPHLDLMPTPGALPGSSEAYGRLLMVAEAPAAVAAAGGGPQGTGHGSAAGAGGCVVSDLVSFPGVQ